MFYKKLDIDDFQKVQNKIIHYVTNFVLEDVKNSEEKNFFKFVSDNNLKKFKEDIPELFECIQKELGSEIIFMSYTYADGLFNVPIHIDSVDESLKKRIRLNWPILNGTSAETIFYEKKNENISPRVENKSEISYRTYDQKDCYKVDSYKLDVPTLMNVRQPHAVKILSDRLPRILLTMRLSNEEEVYQKYFFN